MATLTVDQESFNALGVSLEHAEALADLMQAGEAEAATLQRCASLLWMQLRDANAAFERMHTKSP